MSEWFTVFFLKGGWVEGKPLNRSHMFLLSLLVHAVASIPKGVGKFLYTLNAFATYFSGRGTGTLTGATALDA